MHCDKAPSWYCARYRNAGNIDEYLGDTQPYFVEVVAVRFSQWLGGDYSLDWTYEPCIIALLRETAPGYRLGSFFIYCYVALGSAWFLERPLPFEFDITNHPNSGMQFGDGVLIVTMYLWTLDLLLLSLSHFLIRYHGAAAHCGEDACCVPFLRAPVRQLREIREQKRMTGYTYILRLGYALFFASYFVFGTVSIHTVLGNMYITGNVPFAWLLVLKSIMMAMASTADLTDIGSPYAHTRPRLPPLCLLFTRACAFL